MTDDTVLVPASSMHLDTSVRFHRADDDNPRVFACQSKHQQTHDPQLLSRADAEAHGLKPCKQPACFGPEIKREYPKCPFCGLKTGNLARHLRRCDEADREVRV